MSSSETRQRVVIKLGTGLLTADAGAIDTDCIQSLADDIAELIRMGYQPIVVSSGAVGLGMGRLGITERPRKLPALQKCAAVGQSILIETWQAAFRPHQHTVAQVLLTGSDMLHKSHNRIFGAFLEEILAAGLIPIVNENDSVSSDGFRLGDNDSLAALLACRVDASTLFILSTVEGLLNRETGELIERIEQIDASIEALAGNTESSTAVGGMTTKIRAARLATSYGCRVFIGAGRQQGILVDAAQGRAQGSWFEATATSAKARKRISQKRWRVLFSVSKGSIRVDEGAARALLEQGSSLLAKGLLSHRGNIAENDVVDIETPDGTRIARGICEYDSETLARIEGCHSEEIAAILPHRKRTEVIHRDSLILEH